MNLLTRPTGLDESYPCRTRPPGRVPLFPRRALATLALLAGSLAPAAAHALEVPYDLHVPLTPENSIIGHYSATKPPVARIKSGTTVRIDGGGGARWREGVTPDEWLAENGIDLTLARSPALAESHKVLAETPRAEGIPSGHFIVGPIYIEDAEPGDSLEVRILAVSPRIPFGTVSSIPGRGGLPDLARRPFTKVVHLDLARNAGVFDEDIEVPLAPFMGIMGTCPPDEDGPARRSGPPGLFGGNIDCKELVVGATIHLPVFQKGALFYTGDSHAAQGDGEISINAIETANTCTLQFILHKGRTLKAPRAETPTHYLAFGLHEDLDGAMRMAMLEAIDFLREKQGLGFEEAYTLSSIAVDFRVTQVVDGTQGIHAMIPKRIFVRDANPYWYRPN